MSLGGDGVIHTEATKIYYNGKIYGSIKELAQRLSVNRCTIGDWLKKHKYSTLLYIIKEN